MWSLNFIFMNIENREQYIFFWIKGLKYFFVVDQNQKKYI